MLYETLESVTKLIYQEKRTPQPRKYVELKDTEGKDHNTPLEESFWFKTAH